MGLEKINGPLKESSVKMVFGGKFSEDGSKMFCQSLIELREIWIAAPDCHELIPSRCR